MVTLEELLEFRDSTDYQRDNFDGFLKKISFSYTVPSIHITGTNGKGTTATYIASVYQEAGYKVGLYTSPHFYEINESIVVNNKSIDDETIKKYVKDKEKFIKKFNLSPFEVETYIALRYFQECGCDIAIVECGMGGELDATNVIDGVLSIITSISIEHTIYLGRSISEIAEHKCGIIKDERPVIIGEFGEEAREVITKTCLNRNATAHVISVPSNVKLDKNGHTFDYQIFSNIHIKSLANYSVTNACYALEAISNLMDRFPVSVDAIRQGLDKVTMPGRMEVIKTNPLIILDGAHNPEGMEKLSEAITKYADGRKIHTIFACFKDKNFTKMIGTIGEISEEVVLTTFPHIRARDYDDYFLFVEEHRFEEDAIKAIKEAKEANPDDIILVTGSLAFVAYIRKIANEGGLD